LPTTSNGRPKSLRAKIAVATAIAVASVITVVVTNSAYLGEIGPSTLSSRQPHNNNNNNNNDVHSSVDASSSSNSSMMMMNIFIGRGNNNSLFRHPTDAEEWLTYHHDFFRTAFDSYKSKPALSSSFSIHKNWTSSNLDGAIYAEPLIAQGRVFVATENNSIYSLDAYTGKVIWRTNLGPPVPLSDLPCGDIDPTGITGTPVIDLRTQTIFAVGFLRDTHRHELFAIDIGTGKVRFETAIDPPSSSDPLVEQQRAALALNYYTERSSGSNNDNNNRTANEATRRGEAGTDGGIIVYVSFGGLFGDCGQYHGWMVATPISYVSLLQGTNVTNRSDNSLKIMGNTSVGSLGTTVARSNNESKQPHPLFFSFKVPTVREGGIWAPSGPAIDRDGNIIVATGNSESVSNFDFGNAVIKLSPELGKVIDWFAPSNWADLDRTDTDLGSVGPAILDNNVNYGDNNHKSTNSSSSSIFQVGKEGIGYILRSNKLGGMNGQVFSGPVCDGGAYGGTAYAAPYLYVACRDGLVSLYLHPPAPVNITTTTAALRSGDRGSIASDSGIGNEGKDGNHDHDGGTINKNNTYSSFTVRWHGPPFWASPPIVADGLVWTVDINNGELYAFDQSTGNVLFHENFGHVTHFSTPSSAHGTIFVPAYDRIMSFSIK
jgi:outer membrane protein assembly factor BamB